MRNFDLQFDRQNEKVRMVRADCNPAPGFDFNAFYMAHTDDREDVHPIDPTKAPETAKVDNDPVAVEVKSEGNPQS
jgi:predicted cupin superfamily sugar epimerase